MKLTLTREQIPLARETVAWLRNDGDMPKGLRHQSLPGYSEWWGDNRDDCSEDGDWADALEAAIAEAEGTQAPRPGPVSDADERAFWREVFMRTYDGTPEPGHSAACADEALARYRAAFCTGMPSDQKGAK